MLDAVVASVEPVVPGLGPLAGMLAALAGDLAGADPAVVTLEAMEELVTVRGRELLRAVLQYALDARAAAEVRLPGVTGTDGVTRTLAERGHARTVVTTVGPVSVQRIGYRVWVEREALALGLKGWVRNRRDGSVEVLVGGPPQVVAELIERCWKGPPLSKVESIDVEDAAVLDLGFRRPLENFSLLATE